VKALGEIRYERLRHAIASGSTSLDMCVEGQSITNACMIDICSCLMMLIVVVTLICVDVIIIPGSSIGVEGMKALVPVLKSLSQLTSLNLSGE